MARKYGYSEDSSLKAPEKIAQAINLIDKQLLGQADKGSPYLIGDGITALDIYWATMSMAISPVSLNIMPATQQNQGMLKMFEMVSTLLKLKVMFLTELKNTRTLYLQSIVKLQLFWVEIRYKYKYYLFRS